MGRVHHTRMIKVQVSCSMGCKWCMAYAYILVCYVIPRASPSDAYICHTPLQHIQVHRQARTVGSWYWYIYIPPPFTDLIHYLQYRATISLVVLTHTTKIVCSLIIESG